MNNNSSMLLIVQVNGTPRLEYDREKTLTSAQQQSLILMDEKINQGLSLGNKQVANPSLEQRVEFVAANLISAVLNDEEVLAAASCAYLAHALPDLKQIKALEKNGDVSIELIFDREYQPEEKLNFVPPGQYQQ
ncbi:MAG: hypothetical protein OEQ24_02355 [Gammaproteobacteria bacterium]|nr:hypothetical protein [Gammaproteobacteria bacterium]